MSYNQNEHNDNHCAHFFINRYLLLITPACLLVIPSLNRHNGIRIHDAAVQYNLPPGVVDFLQPPMNVALFAVLAANECNLLPKLQAAQHAVEIVVLFLRPPGTAHFVTGPCRHPAGGRMLPLFCQ